jgi:hypothetical protein
LDAIFAMLGRVFSRVFGHNDEMEAQTQIPRAPSGLAARGKALWRRINETYELDALEAELLSELCRCLDRCDQITAELDQCGSLTVVGSAGQLRAHPLLGTLVVEQQMADRLAGSLAIAMPGSTSRGRAHQRKAAAVRWSKADKPIAIAGGA